MIAFPNAKINIGLKITGRRKDGYHFIESAMVPIGWRDVLEIVPSKESGTTLTVSGHMIDCPPEKNIVIKAYRTLEQQIPLPPVEIHLHKNIPDGAGLGGGSSDGAFTLKLLNEMFSLGLDTSKLAEVAAGIGADCPFFIYNRPMFATGIGTDLSPLGIDLNGKHIVVVKPPVHISTAEAYSGVVPVKPLVDIRAIIMNNACRDWKQYGVDNDFEKSILPKYTTIAEIKKRLEMCGAEYVSMSGSGSAVYAIFADDKLADKAYMILDGYDRYKGKL